MTVDDPQPDSSAAETMATDLVDAAGFPSISQRAFPAPSAPATDSLFIDRPSVIAELEANPNASSLAADKYEIRKPIARGGMGEVVLVRDHDLNRNVAMKTLLPNSTGSFVGRLIEEAQTIGQLEHPNIVPVYDIGKKATGEIYFTMKYLDGQTLDKVIERLRAGDADTHAEYTWNRRIRVIQELCDALSFAHAQGVVHRDLKPANVMIGAFGEVILMDWGIARVAANAGVKLAGLGGTEPDGSISGTPGYMAPEQAAGKLDQISPRTDLFSLGVIGYELFSLKRPFEGSTSEILEKITNTEPIDLENHKSPHQSAVPIELRYILKKVLVKDPAERLGCARELKRELQKFVDGTFPVLCPHTAAKRALSGLSHLIDRHAKIVILSFLAISFGLVATIVWLALT